MCCLRVRRFWLTFPPLFFLIFVGKMFLLTFIILFIVLLWVYVYKKKDDMCIVWRKK